MQHLTDASAGTLSILAPEFVKKGDPILEVCDLIAWEQRRVVEARSQGLDVNRSVTIEKLLAKAHQGWGVLVAALMHGLTLQLFGRMRADGREPGPEDIAAVTNLQDRRLAAIAADDRRRRWMVEKITRGELHSYLARVVGAVDAGVSDEGERERLKHKLRRLAGPEGMSDGNENEGE